MITGILAAIACAIGFAGGRVVSATPRRRRVKHPCPWEPCGYPLSETPLYRNNGNSYADEECAGCGQAVVWNPYRGGYVRLAPR